MVKRNDTRWKSLQPDGIAAAMTGISQRVERWLGDRSDYSSSLWDALAQSLWPRRRIDKCDRTWLRTVFVDNRENVQGLFRVRVDSVLYEPVTPLAASTPRSKQQKYCVCQKRYNASEDSMIACDGCQEWYHPVCINADFASAAADSSWRCPRCLGLQQNKFPDGWEHSVQQPRQQFSISGIPLTVDQGKFIQETMLQTGFVDLNAGDQLREGSRTDEVPFCTEVENTWDFEEVSVPQEMHSDCSSDYPTLRTSSLKTTMVISSPGDDSASEPCSPRRSCTPPSEVGSVQDTGCRRTFLLQTIWLHNTDEEEHDFETRKPKKSRKRKQPHDDQNSPKRTWETPSCICMNVPLDIWRRFHYTKDSGTLRLRHGWTDYFRKEMGNFLPQCGFTFECHKVYDSTTAYFHASGYCKARNCISFTLSGSSPPTAKHSMEVRMVINGICCHGEDEFFRTRIQNQQRDEIKSRLKTTTSAALATSLHREANMEAVDGGNMTSLPPRKLLRQMRYEMNEANDFAMDPLQDVQLMAQEESKNGKPYIRYYSSTPQFEAVCFLDTSLDVLEMMRTYKHRAIGHLDATGSLIRRLPVSCGKKPVFVYSFVVTNPQSGVPEIALLEFIMNSHSLTSISNSLSKFVSLIEKRFGPKSHLRLFKRVETDFALAMIGGVLHSFLHTNLLDYLTRCWHVLFNNEVREKFSIHVCRAHVMKRFSEQVQTYFTRKSICVSPLMSILSAYLKSYKMESILFRVSLLLRLLSHKYVTPEVQQDIDVLTSRTPPSFGIEIQSDWLQFDVSRGNQNKTIHRSSAFGRFFYTLLTPIRESSRSINTSCTTLERNPYFNIGFRKYLMVSILPYTPILTHIMMRHNGDKGEEDCNNGVENWNRHIKHGEHGRLKKVKVGCFLRASKIMMEGRYNEYKGNVLRYYRTKGIPAVRPTVYRTPKRKVVRVVKKQRDVPTEAPQHTWEEEWNRGSVPVASRNAGPSTLFDVPIILWGTPADEETPYKFFNTCTIDNVMMILYLMSANAWLRLVQTFFHPCFCITTHYFDAEEYDHRFQFDNLRTRYRQYRKTPEYKQKMIEKKKKATEKSRSAAK